MNLGVDLELADRVHRNLMEVSRWTGETAGGAFHARDGELFFAARSAMPFLNGVMRERGRGDPAAVLERARSFFSARGRGFVAYSWPGDPELGEAALAAGMFPVLERYPEMVCRAPVDPLPGDIRPVSERAEANAYWEICDAAYPSLGFPPGLFKEAFEPDDLLNSDRVQGCIGYAEDQPAACASLWLAEGVGMVGWVAARPEARGRGLAAACTAWVTNRAFERRAEVASLQASTMGERLYQRLGYEELFAYRLLGAAPE